MRFEVREAFIRSGCGKYEVIVRNSGSINSIKLVAVVLLLLGVVGVVTVTEGDDVPILVALLLSTTPTTNTFPLEEDCVTALPPS